MFRTPFALMAFMTVAALPLATPSWSQTNANEPNAPESATDATTHMDRQLGNEQPQPDRTLSNAEVRRLNHENTARVAPTVSNSAATTDTSAAVSGSHE